MLIVRAKAPILSAITADQEVKSAMLGDVLLVGLFALIAAIVLGSAIWSDLVSRGDDTYKYH